MNPDCTPTHNRVDFMVVINAHGHSQGADDINNATMKLSPLIGCSKL